MATYSTYIQFMNNNQISVEGNSLENNKKNKSNQTKLAYITIKNVKILQDHLYLKIIEILLKTNVVQHIIT